MRDSEATSLVQGLAEPLWAQSSPYSHEGDQAADSWSGRKGSRFPPLSPHDDPVPRPLVGGPSPGRGPVDGPFRTAFWTPIKSARHGHPDRVRRVRGRGRFRVDHVFGARAGGRSLDAHWGAVCVANWRRPLEHPRGLDGVASAAGDPNRGGTGVDRLPAPDLGRVGRRVR